MCKDCLHLLQHLSMVLMGIYGHRDIVRRASSQVSQIATVSDGLPHRSVRLLQCQTGFLTGQSHCYSVRRASSQVSHTATVSDGLPPRSVRLLQWLKSEMVFLLVYLPTLSVFSSKLFYSLLRSRHFFGRLRHLLRKPKVPEPTPAPSQLGRLRHRLQTKMGGANSGSWHKYFVILSCKKVKFLFLTLSC